MEMKHVWLLTTRNIRRGISKPIQMFLCFFIISFLLSTYVAYTLGIQKNMEKIENGEASGATLSLVISRHEYPAAIKQISALAPKTQLRVIVEDEILASIADSALRIGGIDYPGRSVSDITMDRTLTQRELILPCSISRESLVYADFPHSEKIEYQYKFDGVPMIAGSVPSVNGDLLVSDYLLARYGITDIESVIGEQIEIIDNNSVLLENVKICGVVDARYFQINSRLGSPHLLLYSDSVEGYVQTEEIYIRVFARSYDDLETILLDFKKHLPFRLEINHMSAQLHENLLLQRNVKDSILLLIYLVLLLSVFLYLVFAILVNIRNRKVHIGILRATGVSDQSIFKILLLEMMFPALLASVLSLVFALIAISGLGVLLGDQYWQMISWAGSDMIIMLLIVLMCDMFICLLIGTLTWRWYTNKNSIEAAM